MIYKRVDKYLKKKNIESKILRRFFSPPDFDLVPSVYGGQIWCWGWWGGMRHYLRLSWRSCPCLISEILSFDLQSTIGSKKYMNFEFELHIYPSGSQLYQLPIFTIIPTHLSHINSWYNPWCIYKTCPPLLKTLRKNVAKTCQHQRDYCIVVISYFLTYPGV